MKYYVAICEKDNSVCGKNARANTAGGNAPTFRISSLYNQQ